MATRDTLPIIKEVEIDRCCQILMLDLTNGMSWSYHVEDKVTHQDCNIRNAQGQKTSWGSGSLIVTQPKRLTVLLEKRDNRPPEIIFVGSSYAQRFYAPSQKVYKAIEQFLEHPTPQKEGEEVFTAITESEDHIQEIVDGENKFTKNRMYSEELDEVVDSIMAKRSSKA